MSIPGRIAAFLTYFNTHRFFWIGVIVAFLSLGLIGGKGDIDLWATAQLDGFAGVVHAYVDGAAAVAMVVLWPAIVAAALGRPPQIPAGPKS